jgi:hypothetical protein
MATMQEMVEAVKAHAQAHYSKRGWDTSVECYEDAELAEEIAEGKCTTVKQAIAYVGKGCKLRHDYEKDIRAERF